MSLYKKEGDNKMPKFSRNVVKVMANQYRNALHDTDSFMSDKMELRMNIFDYANNTENEDEKEEYRQMLMQDSFGISPEGQVDYDATKQFIQDLGSYSVDQNVNYVVNIKNRPSYIAGEGLHKMNRTEEYLSSVKAFATSDIIAKYNKNATEDKIITPGIVEDWYNEARKTAYDKLSRNRKNIIDDSANIQAKALQRINLSEEELKKKQEEAGKKYDKLLVSKMEEYLEENYAEIKESGVADDKEHEPEIVYKDEIRKEQEKGQFAYDPNKDLKADAEEIHQSVAEKKEPEADEKNMPDYNYININEMDDEYIFDDDKYNTDFYRVKLSFDKISDAEINYKKSKETGDVVEKDSLEEADKRFRFLIERAKTSGKQIIDTFQEMKNNIPLLESVDLYGFLNKQKSEFNNKFNYIENTKKEGHQDSSNYFKPVKNALNGVLDINYKNVKPTEAEVRDAVEKYNAFIEAADRYVNHYDWGIFNFLKSSEGNSRRNQIKDLKALAIQRREEFKWLGQEVLFFNEIDSTNDELKKRAEKGAREGMVIAADRQVKGKGRRGKTGRRKVSLPARAFVRARSHAYI